ncbi:MAG: type VII toxin-antitoxin system HepT family RNase toxin [Candidatus Ranarchaeia archaeon]
MKNVFPEPVTPSSVVAALQLGVPETYSSCIDLVSEKGIISKTLAKDLVKIVKMRNIVVHQYASIDYSILYSSLKRLRKDFLRYKKEVIDWLGS